MRGRPSAGAVIVDGMISPKQPVQPTSSQTLAASLGTAPTGGLEDVISALRRLEDAARGAAPMPEPAEPLTEIDMATPLTRTLRAGILDELGWEALDEAAAELDGESWCRASWPILTVHDRRKAIAVGPGGRMAEHRLRVPRGAAQFSHDPAVYFSDGEFLVCHYINGQQTHYWSNTPDETFTVRPGIWKSYYYGGRATHGYTFLAPNGRRFMGHTVLKPRERRLGPHGHMFHDGQDFWWHTADGSDSELHRINQGTGKLDVADPPDFLDPSLLREGERWDFTSSYLAPLPHGVDGSPLGSNGTHVGLRVTEDRTTGRVRYERVDGVRGEFDGSGVTAVWGLLDIPGADRPLVLSGGNRLYDPVLARDADTGALYWAAERMNTGWTTHEPSLVAAGTRLMPPSAFWHFLTPRDTAGSAALRQTSEDTVRRLLKAAATSEQRLHEAIGSLLPEISHPLLVRGVAGVVREAVETLRSRDTLVRRLTRPAIPRLEVQPKDLDQALDGLLRTASGASGVIVQIELASAFLAGTIDSETAMEHWLNHSTGCDWTELAGRVGGLAVRAVSAVTGAADRDALVDLLRFWARSPLVQPGLQRGLLDAEKRVALRGPDGALMPLDIAMRYHDWGRAHSGAADEIAAYLQHVTMPRPAGFIDSRPVPDGWATRERLYRLLSELKRRGPVPFDPDAADRLADATGLDRAGAALLMAGLPHIESGSHNFLPPEVRKTLRLKAAEARAGRDRVSRELPYAARLPFYDAAMPDDPAELWDQAAMAGRLAQAWKAAVVTNS